MQKINGLEEANKIIVGTEVLVKKGYKLTIEQECCNEFAKILLEDIGKRRRNRGGSQRPNEK